MGPARSQQVEGASVLDSGFGFRYRASFRALGRYKEVIRWTQRSKELETAVDFTTAIAADARKVLFPLM